MSSSTAASSTAQDAIPASCDPIPRGARRRREIAAVAERVFFAHGFTDTTMQTIAAEAGASKETLYRHFGSKEGLFSEIVESRANRFLERIDEDLQRPGAVADVLRDFGLKMLQKMMESDGVCLFRLVVAEGPRNPELGRIFYEQGPERVSNRLARFLSAATERGDMTCPDVNLAASIFLGAIMAQHHMIGLMVPERAPIEAVRIAAHIDEVVAMFLTRYRAD